MASQAVTNLLKSKTFWTGVSAVVAAGGGYATGEVSGAQAVQLAFTGALGVFARMALAKIDAKVSASDQQAP